jgi:hypothetical protein
LSVWALQGGPFAAWIFPLQSVPAPATKRSVPQLIAGALLNGFLLDLIETAAVIAITLVATPEHSEWNGLPVNNAAGLEAGL